MIRLLGMSHEKVPKDYNPDGTVKTWQWRVFPTESGLAYCDSVEEADEFIALVRIRTAVHNNFNAKKSPKK